MKWFIFSKSLTDAIFTAFFQKCLKEQFCFHDHLILRNERTTCVPTPCFADLRWSWNTRFIPVFVCLCLIRVNSNKFSRSY